MSLPAKHTDELIEEARRAFRRDPEYIVLICRAASDLARRRAVWDNRRKATKTSAVIKVT